nr:MAG TPA: hypothetical protein [Caudoviricetes sp.]
MGTNPLHGIKNDSGPARTPKEQGRGRGHNHTTG